MSELLTINYTQPINSQGLNQLIQLIECNEQIKSIRININSLGGTVGDAIAMYNYLKLKGIHVWTHNMGDVQSSAFLLYLAGTIRTTESIAKFVVHPIRLGNATDCTYHEVEERLLGLKADIDNYATIVKKECPAFHNIDEFLKTKSYVFTPDQAKVLGVVTG